MRASSFLSVALVFTLSCGVDNTALEAPESGVFFDRADDAGEPFGECFDCPWGEIATFHTGGRVLTKNQWVGAVEDLGEAWCADNLCRDCSTGGEAKCEYDDHDFVAVGADGTSATAEMYCSCPLW